LKISSLTVTPILYLSNGVRYALPAVTLAPSGTAVVDINQSLAQQGIAPYATLYGYVEIDYQWPWAVVCATVRNVDFVNSLIFANGLGGWPGRKRLDEFGCPTLGFLRVGLLTLLSSHQLCE
jgi:hypothetical protein